MKRAIIAAALLIGSLAICFGGYFTLSHTCRLLQPPLKEITAAAQSGDSETALKKAKEFAKIWEKEHGKIEALTQHAETDELEEIIKSLPVLARQGSLERLEEQSETAYNRLDHVINNEKPLLSNIF